MLNLKTTAQGALLATGLAIGLASVAAIPADARQSYKMSTLAPGSSSYIVGTSFARVVMKYLPDVDIRVNSTGTGTQQTLNMARGKTDFAHFGGPSYYWMVNQTGPYRKVKDSRELVKGLRNLFSFPLGDYTMLTYADSGIKTLKDIKGKRVYLGPPGGGATRVITTMITESTGYTPGEDFKTVKMGWGAARQSFQDGNIDLWVSPANNPDAKIEEIALSNKIRILSLQPADLENAKIKKLLAIPGRTVVHIPADVYGKNQVNTEASLSLGTWLAFGVRADMPEDVVYEMMKAFWGHIDEVQNQAAWLKNSLRLETAFAHMAGPLHPGAIRYYREVGLTIPENLIPKE